MTTHGGSYTLTPDGLDYTPKPIVTKATPSLLIEIHDWLTVERAFQDYERTRPMRKRRKPRPAPIKRKSRDTAIAGTRSWTGITEWGMVPATREMQKVFDAERALERIKRNDPAEQALRKLEKALAIT